MMGVGKTSIGKDLSYKLNMEFIDIDSIIEKKLSIDNNIIKDLIINSTYS